METSEKTIAATSAKLRLLEIVASSGRCMPLDVDMTPDVPLSDIPKTSVEWKRYNDQRRAAESICKLCDVRVPCAVYAELNDAYGVTGRNVLTEPEKREFSAALGDVGGYVLRIDRD